MNNQGVLQLFIIIYYDLLLLFIIMYDYLLLFNIIYYYLFLFIFIITSTTAIYSSSYHLLDHTKFNPLINMLIPTTLTCYVSFCNAPFLDCAAICWTVQWQSTYPGDFPVTNVYSALQLQHIWQYYPITM